MIIRTSIVHATILLSLAFSLNAKPRRTKAQHIQNKQLINAAASGNYEKVKHLLETNSAKINEMSHDRVISKTIALVKAEENGHKNIVEILLQNNEMSLINAARKGQKEIVEILLKTMLMLMQRQNTTIQP